jgi:hypothetical protein
MGFLLRKSALHQSGRVLGETSGRCRGDLCTTLSCVRDTLSTRKTTTCGVACGHATRYSLSSGANIPVVPSSETVVQDSFDLRPATPGGSITGSILGNDQILCGNVASTFYLVRPMKDNTHPLRDGVAYVICSSSSTLTTCGNAASPCLPQGSELRSTCSP